VCGRSGVQSERQYSIHGASSRMVVRVALRKQYRDSALSPSTALRAGVAISALPPSAATVKML